MANSIALIRKDLAVLDEVYKMASKTSILDNTALAQETDQANEIRVAKMVLQGLGDYDRNTGYALGDNTITWLTHQFTQDRGRKFAVDTMDDLETAKIAFGRLAGEFLRNHVVPELDAYRIALYHSEATNTVAADLTTSSAVLTAIDLAIATLDDAEVPEEGRVMFVANGIYNLLKNATNIDRRIGDGNDGTFDRRFITFDGMRVVKMPPTRFYDSITQNDGVTAGQEAGGYAKTPTTGKDLNFQIIHPSCIAYQGSKHVVNKVITPQANQDSDAWLFFYRNYHDTFVFDNKQDGIYSHSKA